MKQSNLSLVWWNTSLSPPISSKRGKAELIKLDRVCWVIGQFLQSEYDFICLGEVCDDDINYFEQKLNLKELNYLIVKAAKKLNRSYFDTCIIYKKYHLLLPVYGEDAKYLSFNSGTNLLKTATRFLFNLSPPFNESLLIYLCHWPSKLRDTSLDVISISERCRVDVEIQAKNTDNIILMGDFNLEPFEKALVHNLQTSRAKDVVLDKPNIFYNPFWKFLVTLPNEIKGTYHYSNGRFHRDLVIDQMIFSSSFLSERWNFSDDLIDIVDIPNFKGKKNQISDHLPIVGIIERKML